MDIHFLDAPICLFWPDGRFIMEESNRCTVTYSSGLVERSEILIMPILEGVYINAQTVS